MVITDNELDLTGWTKKRATDSDRSGYNNYLHVIYLKLKKMFPCPGLRIDDYCLKYPFNHFQGRTGAMAELAV